MQDGAALDLSACRAPFDVKGTGKKGTILQFAEAAKVTVKLGDRKVRSGERLVIWTDETRPEGVSFTLEPGTRGVLREDATGLHYIGGYRIIVR